MEDNFVFQATKLKLSKLVVSFVAVDYYFCTELQMSNACSENIKKFVSHFSSLAGSVNFELFIFVQFRNVISNIHVF